MGHPRPAALASPVVRRVDVVGIGPGDPDQITFQAVTVLRSADAYLLFAKPREEVSELNVLRAVILDRHVGGGWRDRVLLVEDPPRGRGSDAAAQRAAVKAWREERSRRLTERLAELPEDARIAIPAWGDPALYDATLGVLADVKLELDVHVVPGIGAPSALAAAHGIGLNQVGGAVQITTGRRVAAGLPDGVEDVVVMLDPDCRFAELAEDEQLDLYWGAYLGAPDQLLVAGPLAEVAVEAQRVRAEAKDRKGWVFDTYLLRRRRS